MKDTLSYKGYHAKVRYDSEGQVFRGVIEGITDYVDFECNDIEDVEKTFRAAVDDYIAFCKVIGKTHQV